MNDIIIGLIVFTCIFAGGMGGLLLSPLLPTQHRSTETRDVVRLGMGMISVLASLVLGLLTASAKGTFDNADQQLRSYSADLIMLDQTLRDYGDEADAIRAMLVRYTDQAVRTTWPEEAPAQRQPLEDKNAGELLDRAMQAVLALSPTNDRQQWLRSHALEIAGHLIRTRWSVLVGQEGSISPVLLGIMVVWITVIFASFGLNAPRNMTVAVAFLLCAASIGASVFLIEEMDTPFSGVIMVSGAPMKNALAHLNH